MDAVPRSTHHSRDHSHHLSDHISALLLSRAPSRPSCAPPKPHKTKQTPLASDAANISPLNIKLALNTANPCWLPQTRRTGLQSSLHQSTCLNLNLAATDSTASDLWILPDFDDWELDSDSPAHSDTKANDGEWSPLLHRAASSNRERLRARLEGDGWDFVGGKYGDEDGCLQEQSQESVDEEFDVVVLPARVGC